MKKGGQELQARRLLSESSTNPRAGLKDIRGRQRLVNLHTHVHVPVRPALVKASEQKKRLGLTRGRQGRQLVVGASPSFLSDGWRRVSKVDFGDGSLIHKHASE